MRQPPRGLLVAVLVSVLGIATAGCGSSSPAKTAKADVATKFAKIAVKSSAIVGEHIQARYTCDGQGVSPPLEWGSVPADVHQLALFLIGFRPKPGTKTYSVSVEWAVAGLSPSLHRIAAGQLPAGAYLGAVNAHGHQRYDLCPEKGTTVHYQFELYGVPAALGTIPAHFAGVALLHELTVPSGRTRADAHGGFVALYKRN